MSLSAKSICNLIRDLLTEFGIILVPELKKSRMTDILIDGTIIKKVFIRRLILHMKIKCENCGKQYNYEKHMGICPKCGRYVRQADIYDQDSAIEEWNTQQKEQNTKKFRKYKSPVLSKPKKSSSFYIQIGICILLLVIVCVFPSYYQKETEKLIEDIYQDQKVKNVKTTECKLGDKISIPEYDITLTDVSEYETEELEVPEGWKYVQVSYVSEGELQYTGFCGTATYLQTEGHFYYPMYLWDITNDELLIDRLRKEEGITTGYHEEKGKFLFLIPQEAQEATLHIREYTESKYYEETCIPKLQKISYINLDFKGEERNE